MSYYNQQASYDKITKVLLFVMIVISIASIIINLVL